MLQILDKVGFIKWNMQLLLMVDMRGGHVGLATQGCQSSSEFPTFNSISEGVSDDEDNWEFGKSNFCVTREHTVRPSLHWASNCAFCDQMVAGWDMCLINIRSDHAPSCWISTTSHPKCCFHPNNFVRPFVRTLTLASLTHFFPQNCCVWTGGTFAFVHLVFDVVTVPPWPPLQEVYWDLLSAEFSDLALPDCNFITKEHILVPGLEWA